MMRQKENLFENIPESMPEELVTVLAESEHVRIERIVSEEHASPEGFWYDQVEHEWVVVLSGWAELSIEGPAGIERVELRPGDHLLLPAHRRHRVEKTSGTEKTIWLAVFYSA